MSKVDFEEIADGVARGSDSNASTPEAKKLIRALLRSDPGEVPYGEFRDFVRALVEGRPEHALHSYRDLVKAVVCGRASSAPYDQRDLAKALVRRYGTESRSRGLSRGLDRDALVALDHALGSRSERNIDWPELRALAVALLELSPHKAPSNDWREFVDALRSRDPDAAPSSLRQMAQAAILGDAGLAPSGWPRAFVEILIHNQIPKPMTVISAESDSDLRDMARSLEKGNPYAVSNQRLRGIVEAVQKRDPSRASVRFRGFVEALLKGDRSRAPQGEMQEIAKAVVRKRPGDLPSGPLRELAIALVEALEPPLAIPTAVADARRVSSRAKERGKAPALKGRKDPPAVGGVLAALLANDPEKARPGVARWVAAGLLAAEQVDAKGDAPPGSAARVAAGRGPAAPASSASEPVWEADEAHTGDSATSGDRKQSARGLYLQALEDLPLEFSPGRLAAVGQLRMAWDIPFWPIREHVIRCYLRILKEVARQGLVPEKLAETLLGLDEPLGLTPEGSAILRAAAIDALASAKVRNDVAPEASAAYIDRVREILGVPPRSAPGADAAPAVQPPSPPAPPAPSPPPPPPPPQPRPEPPPPPIRAGSLAAQPLQVSAPKPRRLRIAVIAVFASVVALGTVTQWAEWEFPGIAALNDPAQAPSSEPRINDDAAGKTRALPEPQEVPQGPFVDVADASATTGGNWSPGSDAAPEGGPEDQPLAGTPDARATVEEGSEADDDGDGNDAESTDGDNSSAAAPVAVVSVAVPTGGGPREATPAELAWDEGDWTTAFKLYLLAAARGDLEAEVRLGRMYYDGFGRPADPRGAEARFRKAAGLGSAEAKYRLGLLYSDNRPSAPWDLDVARQFFVEAADTHPMAALKLGYFYARGIGVREDHDAATKWFQQAAKLGSAEAAERLRSNR